MKPSADDYPVILTQDVHWGDMDAFGHVNNSVYFRYFEDARLACFEKIGVLEYVAEHNVGPILATTRCDFRRPVQYPDRIYITAHTELQSPKKLHMTYKVFSDNHGGVAAEGEGLIVYYDYNANASCEVPQVLVERIQSFESGS